MPKTYTTIPSVSTGDVYTAAAHNNVATTLNNHTVPPTVMVRRTTNLTGYTSGTNITWESEGWTDTDDMWTSGATVTINTAGLYLIGFTYFLTATATLTLLRGDIKVGTAVIAASTGGINGGVNGYGSMHVVADLAATNTVAAALNLAGGSAYVVNGNAALDGSQTRLSVTWIGRTS